MYLGYCPFMLLPLLLWLIFNFQKIVIKNIFKGIICMCLGILPFVGVTAYLLYLFQPFASFCVTGTV